MDFTIQIAIAAAVSLTAPVTQDKQKVASPLIERLAKCLEIKGDGERLACTDLAARALVDATQRKDIVVVDKEEMKTTRRSLFGFTLPRIGLFGGGDDKDDVKRVELKIVSVSQLGYDKMSFALADGSRWSTTEAWPGAARPVAGQMLTVRKGAMGSYFVSTGGRSVRAMRTG